jgi:hypothetical protein
MANDPSPSQDSTPSTGALDVLTQAIKAVPSVKYALGVAGMASAGFLAISVVHGQNLWHPFLVLFGVLFFMVLLLVFSAAARGKADKWGRPALVLVWAYTAYATVAPIVIVIRTWPAPPPPPGTSDWIQHGNVHGLPLGKHATISVGPCKSGLTDPGGHFTINSSEDCRRAASSNVVVAGFQDFYGPALPRTADTSLEIHWKSTASNRFFEGWIRCGAAGADADVSLVSCTTADNVITERDTGRFRIDVPAECAAYSQLQIVPRGAPRLLTTVTLQNGQATAIDLERALPDACLKQGVTTPRTKPKEERPSPCSFAFTPSTSLGANVWMVTCPCKTFERGASGNGRFLVYPGQDATTEGMKLATKQNWACHD